MSVVHATRDALEGGEARVEKNLPQPAVAACIAGDRFMDDKDAARAQRAAEALQNMTKLCLAVDLRCDHHVGSRPSQMRPARCRLAYDIGEAAPDERDQEFELLSAGNDDFV